MLSLFGRAYFSGKRPASSVNDLLICAALVVGQAEGRLLNASKLAGWLSMARPTVIRRLEALQKQNIVDRNGTSFYVRREVANGAMVLAAGARASELIIAAAGKLSKMDTKAVVRQKNMGIMKS